MTDATKMSWESPGEIFCLPNIVLSIGKLEDVNTRTSALDKRCETRSVLDVVAIESAFVRSKWHSSTQKQDMGSEITADVISRSVLGDIGSQNLTDVPRTTL